MLFYTKTAGFQTWEQEELNSAQFKTQVSIEIFYSANLGNVVKRKLLVAHGLACLEKERHCI